MNIYVGNLPNSASKESLEALFAQHGQVSSVRVITDKFTGAPRGFAFVEMGSRDEATAAIAALNGAEFEGNRLRVNEARPREARPERGGGNFRNNRY